MSSVQLAQAQFGIKLVIIVQPVIFSMEGKVCLALHHPHLPFKKMPLLLSFFFF